MTSAPSSADISPAVGPITVWLNSRTFTPASGVADIRRAKRFYAEALGLPVKKDYRKFVMLSGGDGTSDLGVYKREALADDAAVSPEGSGFRGFTLTHAVDSEEQVEALLNRVAQAGGTVVRPDCFADLDGNLWQVATAVEQS